MFYLFWIFNFFVIATNDGRYIASNYNLDIIFNAYVYIAVFIFYYVSRFVKKNGITDGTNAGFLFCGTYLAVFNLVGYFFGGHLNYFYTSLVLLSSYYIGSTSLENIYKFVLYSLGLLVVYTLCKFLASYFGMDVLPFADIRYSSLSNEGSLRFSNSIVFGQRNTAGAAVASLYIVYSSLVYSNFVKFKFHIFVFHLVLALSAMSATGIIIVLACSLVTSRVKVSRLLFLVGAVFVSLISIGGIDRKIESLLAKVGVFFEFLSNLDLQILLIGAVGESSRPWVESSLLDMVYDIGFLIPAAILIHFLYFFIKHWSERGAVYLYSLFLVLLLISNSTLQPPIILCLILSYNIFKRRGSI